MNFKADKVYQNCKVIPPVLNSCKGAAIACEGMYGRIQLVSEDHGKSLFKFRLEHKKTNNYRDVIINSSDNLRYDERIVCVNCGNTRLKGFPCEHASLVLYRYIPSSSCTLDPKHKKALDYMDPKFYHPDFSMKQFEAQYSSDVLVPQDTENLRSYMLFPPEMKRRSGRKKSARRKTRVGSKTKGSPQRCSFCGNEDHDKRNCNAKNVSQIIRSNHIDTMIAGYDKISNKLMNKISDGSIRDLITEVQGDSNAEERNENKYCNDEKDSAMKSKKQGGGKRNYNGNDKKSRNDDEDEVYQFSGSQNNQQLSKKPHNPRKRPQKNEKFGGNGEIRKKKCKENTEQSFVETILSGSRHFLSSVSEVLGL